MLICGYPGIGKTSLCKQYKKYIDLDSSTFSKNNSEWYIDYCQTAKQLSDEGYIVFISTHKDVRNYLNRNNIDFEIILPSLRLESFWKDTLKKRYFNATTDSNYAAVNRVLQYFVEDITSLLNENKTLILIDDENYDLKTLLNSILKLRDNNGVN